MCNSVWLCFVLVSFVGSAAGANDRFRPPSQPRIFSYGPPSYLRTTGVESLREYWYDVSGRTTFLFGVQSCGSAILYFTEHHGHSSNESLKVVLGANGNSYSQILNAETGEQYDGFTTRNILNCDAFTYFWAQWRYNFVVIGKGNIPGEEVQLTHWIKHENVNSIGLTSSDNEPAVWEVRENSGSILHVYGQGDEEYGRVWKAIDNRVFVPLKIKGCQAVQILLTPNLYEMDGNLYEITISSTQGSIVSQNALGEKQTLCTWHQQFLDCNEYRSLWIGWVNGFLSVGRGLLFGDNILMFCHDDELLLPVRAMAIKSPGEEYVHWRFEDDLETMTTFVTLVVDENEDDEDGDDIMSHRIDTPQKTFATFSVLACYPLSVILWQKDAHGGDEDDEDYYYMLHLYETDDAGKTISGLEMQDAGGYVTSAETPDLLSCTESRDFWISWTNNVIEVGKGKEYGRRPLFPAHTMNETEYAIQSLAFLPPMEGSAVWQVPESAGEKLQVITKGSSAIPIYDNNWRTIQTESHVKFRVQACSHVHVALSETTGIGFSQTFYEVMLGAKEENSTSILSELRIRELSDVTVVLQRIFQGEILDCNEMQDFWISWNGGLIQVGRGMIPGHKVIMGSRNELGLNVRAISFYTSDKIRGLWEFDEDVGDDLVVVTGGLHTYDHFLTIPSYVDYTTFSVQACSDVHLVLTAAPENLEHVEIILGHDGNTQSSIVSAHNGIVANTNQSSVLSCEGTRDFWLFWKDGHVEIGTGVLLHFMSPILMYTAPRSFTPTALIFTSSQQQEATWHWKQRTFPAGLFKTTADRNSTRQLTRTLEHVRNMMFGIKGCGEAHMLFSDEIAIRTGGSFTLRIGSNRNQETVLEPHSQGAMDYRETTPDVLNCTGERLFWAAWYRSSFSFGFGQNVGQNTLLNFFGVQGLTIRSVTLSTATKGTSTIWALPMFEEWYTPANRTEDPPTRAPVIDDTPSGLTSGEIAGIVIPLMLILVIITVLVVLKQKGKLNMPNNSDTFNHVKFTTEDGGQTTFDSNAFPKSDVQP